MATQFFVNGAVFASFIPRLPEIQDRIDVSIDVLGILMTIAGLIGLAGSAAAAVLTDRVGTRRSLIAGAALLLATLPVIGYATTPIVFVLALGLMTALDVVVDVAMNLQGSWLSARRHAPIMNRLHGLWSLGTVVGGLASAQVTAAGVSLQQHLVVVAGVLLCAWVFIGRGLLRVDEHAASTKPEAPMRGRIAWSTFAVLAASGAFAVAVEVTSSDWAAFRLSDDFSASPGFAGLGFVAFTTGMTTGRFVGDSVLARIGADAMAKAAIALSILGLTGAALTPNRYLVLASYVIAGLGISTFFPRLYDDAVQLPGKRGAGLAALTAGSRITGLLIPAVVGGLAATSLSVGAATGIVVIPSAIGFGLLTFYLRGSQH